jgi:hypothetical protein
MTADQWMAIAMGLSLISFVVFAFVQGGKVQPSGHTPGDDGGALLGGF